jgi:hypothetical protein
MHRYSDEDVAAVVLAAVAELRRRRALPDAARAAPDSTAGAAMAGVIRETRAGVLPRQRYERAAGPDDPPYSALPARRRDEEQLAWLITTALTDGS